MQLASFLFEIELSTFLYPINPWFKLKTYLKLNLISMSQHKKLLFRIENVEKLPLRTEWRAWPGLLCILWTSFRQTVCASPDKWLCRTCSQRPDRQFSEHSRTSERLWFPAFLHSGSSSFRWSATISFRWSGPGSIRWSEPSSFRLPETSLQILSETTDAGCWLRFHARNRKDPEMRR